MATKKASTLTVASGTLGVAQTIKINSESKSYRHELTVTINDSVTTLINRSSTATSIQWQLPMWWAQENTTGKTIPCHFELTTYSSSSASSAFGNVSKDIVLTIPSNSETQPDASIQSVVPVNNGIPSNISDLFIQGVSKATVTCQAATKYNATVSQYSVSIGHQGKMARSNIVTTDILQAYGKMLVTLIVRDSRGIYGTAAHYSDKITVQPYEKPIAVGLDGSPNVTCERCTGDGAFSSSGTYLRLRAKAKFSSLAGRNTCTLQYRFKRASANWADNSWISASGLEIDAVLDLNLNVQYAYSVEIRAVDVIGAGPTTPIEIPMDIVPLHLAAGGKNVGIGRYANTEAGTERLDVAWDAFFEKGVTTHGEVEIYGDTPHIDFHHANSNSDYTSRIIENAAGAIDILAPNGLKLNGSNLKYDDTAIKNRLTAIEKKENVTLTANTNRISNVSYTAKYFPLLGMVFVRIYGTISADLNAGYDYDLFTIGSRVPDSNAALSVKCAKNAMALAKTSDKGSAIQISPIESGINGYDVYITGFWFV